MDCRGGKREVFRVHIDVAFVNDVAVFVVLVHSNVGVIFMAKKRARQALHFRLN